MIDSGKGNSSPTRMLLAGAAIFIIIYGMKLSASFLGPILLAGIIGISVLPVATWLARKGIPDWLAIIITIALVILSLIVIILLMFGSIANLVNTLPQYEDNLQGQIEDLGTLLSNSGIESSQILPSLGISDPGKIVGFVSSFLGSIVSGLSDLVVMLMVLIFMLLGAPALSQKLRLDDIANRDVLSRFRQLAQDLRQYVNITTWINFLVALVNVIFLWILGVDFAVLWGVLAFLTGYIPNVGFWIALIPPFLLALVQFGIGKALIVLVGYILINGVVQSFLQPKMMGTGLNLSTFVVVVSLFFWGWVLGPIGALLAVPMTMIVKEAFLDAYDSTRGLSELMSADEPKKKQEQDVSAN